MAHNTIDTAVVVGACALAPRARTGTRVERSTLPDDMTASSIAPQGGFPHVLLGGGAAALQRLAPAPSRVRFPTR